MANLFLLSPVLWIGVLLLGSFACAANVTYDFNITWVLANPDNAFLRPTIGINGQWPVPQITATVGDRVRVNVVNQLGNQTTSLHFHGLYMNGTTHMDGPTGVSQCSIPPGASFTYDFKIDQPGTYWYHSHDHGQYPDGLRGALIVNDPGSPYKGQYDEEIVLTLSDWYHDQVHDLLKSFISVTNPTGAEPVPNAALMNDTQNLTVSVEPGKTYMVRMVNMGAFAAQYVWFEGHTMRIVEVDGIYTEPADADMIYLTAAQRCSVLITTKNDTLANFAFVGSMDQDLFDQIPPTLNPNVTGWLVYDHAKELPLPGILDEFDPFDDFTLVPADGAELFDKVDYSFNLDVKMDNLGDGANYAFFNGVTYVRPKVPTLYTALSTGVSASNVSVYGANTNSFVLNKNDVVEIIVNNDDPGKHPFHLHGHNFQAVVRSEESAGFYIGNETFPKVPMRRDTFMVRPNGNIVLRFRADNPDKYLLSTSILDLLADLFIRVWLFHCHIEWHLSSGLLATMIEAPISLQESLTIPPSHYQICKDQDQPIAGNAAGNTVDFFDLTSQNLPVAPLPAGFTARGVVALIFSCISALLGMAVVVWYGYGEIGARDLATTKATVAEITAGVAEPQHGEDKGGSLHT